MEFSRYETRSYKSGQLGEAFCEEQFGIKEPRYEIKSFEKTHCAFVVQSWQLLDQLYKQYVIVGYRREWKTISRGPNKGKRRPNETIASAYQRKLEVWVTRGYKILQGILDLQLRVYCTAAGGDLLKYGKWGIVWCVPIKVLPTEIFEDTDRYRLYCDPGDPPAWTEEAAASIQGGLFDTNDEDEVPF